MLSTGLVLQIVAMTVASFQISIVLRLLVTKFGWRSFLGYRVLHRDDDGDGGGGDDVFSEALLNE